MGFCLCSIPEWCFNAVEPPETYVQPEISTEDSNPSENYAADTEILEGQPQFDDEAAEEMVFDQSDMTQQEVSFKIEYPVNF